MFVSSLREIPENCADKQGIEYLHRILLTASFLSYDIESAKAKVRLLELHIKIIHFLFYNFVINFSQNLLNILEQISYFIC
jgi:hypothetical protein